MCNCVQIEVDDQGYLQELSVQEFEDLHVHVCGLLREVEMSDGVVLTEAKLPKSVGFDVSRQFKSVNKLSKDLEGGKISRDKFMAGMQTSIHKNFESAYAKGKGVRISDLTDGDREYLRRAVDTEMKFAGGFADDLKAGTVGEVGRMSRERRVQMWSQSVDGVAWHGSVESQPDSVRIFWRLGAAEHCPDCLLLAASSGPDGYTKWNLPTTPRAGDTVCRTKCQCHLVYKTGKLSKADQANAAELGYKKEASLSELLNPPLPPGTRRPTVVERRYIDQKRNEINYYRRQIATGGLDDDVLKDYIDARKAANLELNEFVAQEGIFEVPVYSVDNVIDESHLGRRARRDIARHGLDGGTLDLVDAKLLQRMLNDYEGFVGTTFSDDAIAAALAEAEKTSSKLIKFVAVPYLLREKSDTVSWNLIADTLENTHKLLARAASVARGTAVIVGPFSDELLSRVGVWLEGEPDEVKKVITDMRKEK